MAVQYIAQIRLDIYAEKIEGRETLSVKRKTVFLFIKQYGFTEIFLLILSSPSVFRIDIDRW